LRQIVQSGDYVGELTSASLVAGFRAANFGYPGRRDWLTQPGKGGTGTWMLHGIHTMAQLRYIFGEVETVYLREHHATSFERPDIEGTMSGLLTLKRGIHMSIIQTCETRLTHNLAAYTLYGDKGCLRAAPDSCEVFCEGSEPLIIKYPEATLSEYALEMQTFASYVRGDESAPTHGRSERRSLAVVQAGYESAQSGLPVQLSARFGPL
jgi:predicted dehydrogenase